MRIYNFALNKWVVEPDKDFCFRYHNIDSLYKRKLIKQLGFMVFTSKRRNKNKSFWKNLAFQIVQEKIKNKTKNEKLLKELNQELAYHLQRRPVINDGACLYAKSRLSIVLDALNIANCQTKKSITNKKSIAVNKLGSIFHVSLKNLSGYILVHKKRICCLDFGG